MRGGSVAVNNSTAFSDPFQGAGTGGRVAVTLKRTAGAGSVAVTLQGGWADSAAAGDWVDTTVTVTGHSVDTPVLLGILDDYWVWYRIKVVSTGAATVDFRVKELS